MPCVGRGEFLRSLFGDPEADAAKIVNSLKGGGSKSPAPVIGGSSRDQVISFWQSQGYSPGAAAGWAANAQAESSFNPSASNGTHFGIYQWSAARRAKIKAALGIDVATASLQDQLRAAAWEAGNMGLGPNALPDNAGQSAAAISNRFEVPSLTAGGLASEAAKRAAIANSYGAVPSIPSLGASTPGRNTNVKIDNITIQTQASDSAGIAREVGVELKNQIRMAMSNFDDGVSA
ncbi:phage tail tip lysozyme [Fimbriiglobus ruber]|uniref:phage tail tip lysozyme n=1 Tax=Fimbriiglobus ruber TaxID=1908690 RepID=UPI001EE6FF1D|nr:phage tail tip lysozyme [Fimbriiglobus ruber]